MIQASTRANYASNLALIHGLDTMVGCSIARIINMGNLAHILTGINGASGSNGRQRRELANLP